MLGIVIAAMGIAVAGFYFTRQHPSDASTVSSSPDHEGEKEPEATDAVAAQA